MTAKPQSAQSTAWLRQLWRGQGRPLFQWRALVTGSLLIALGIAFYRAALWSAHWGGTFTLFAFAVLLLSLLSLWLGVRRLWKVTAHLGIRGLLILIITCALLIYLLVGISIGTGLGWAGWSAAGQILIQQAGEQVRNITSELVAVPDDLAVAFFGRSLVGSGTPLIGENLADTSTPLHFAATSPPLARSATVAPSVGDEKITIGMTVQVANTLGSRLRAHKEPSTDTPVTVAFLPNTRLTVVDGPRTTDGYIWWKVQGAAGEGWCAADFLMPVQ
jgi:hypothetical protein